MLAGLTANMVALPGNPLAMEEAGVNIPQRKNVAVYLHTDHNFSRETEVDQSRVREGTHGQSQARHHYCPSDQSQEKPLSELSALFILLLYLLQRKCTLVSAEG